MNQRTATIERATNETKIELFLNIDGAGQIEVQTGLGFFDHMLTALTFHAGWDLRLVAVGDLDVDDHHTIEDCGIALGKAIRSAVGDKQGIHRFGSMYAKANFVEEQRRIRTPQLKPFCASVPL